MGLVVRPSGVPAAPAASAQPTSVDVAAEVRWASLLEQLFRIGEALPPQPSAPRRIGEPAAPPAANVPPPWLDAATAFAVGVLSRCRGRDAGEHELMILTADHLLADRVRWAGRPWWRPDRLGRLLLGRSHDDGAVRQWVQAALAARDPSMSAVVPALCALGLEDRLFPGGEERALRRLIPSPALLEPAPVCAVGPAPTMPARRRTAFAAGAIAVAALAALLVWQALLWSDTMARTAAALAAE